MEPAALQGAVINRRFRLGRLLRASASEWLYEAEDAERIERVLLWLLPPGSDARHALSQSLSAVGSLSHPGLLMARVAGETVIGPAAGMCFLVTESPDGWLADRPPLNADEALQMARDLTAALDYLHKQPFSHRHVSPARIAYANGRWKLAGSGLLDRTSGALWRDALSRGTTGFLAPEALLSRQTAAADMWGLGATLQWALTGRGPCPGSPAEVVHVHATGTYAPCPPLPPPLDLVARGCLMPDVRRRWLAADVLSVLQGGLPPAEERLLAHRPARPRRVHAWAQRPERRLGGHQAAVSQIAWPSEDRLVTGSQDGAVRIWDASTGQVVRAWEPTGARIDAIACHPDGRIAVGDAKGGLRMLDVSETSTEEPIRALWFEGDTLQVHHLTSDIEWVPGGTLDGILRCGGPERSVGSAVLCLQEGICGTYAGRIEYRDLSFEAESAVLQIAVSRDGKTMACCTADCTLRLLTLPTLQWTHAMDAAVRAVAFSPDGQHVACGLSDCSVRIWLTPAPG